ncbi:MAG: hypothetical protein DWG79_01345 [Chloroflexi bacterium]|nr:SRPBCC family protein [Chloroflexota bacterium]MDA1147334.1 SRPBCC family protein [Chloroflexota bacterium]MQC82503.1 hypothetical protein [Chloroflexota bacterium]MQC83143.1 hypothetical protein [Chloroflexota bacterium]
MSMTMTANLEIARPAAVVFDYIANMELNTTWQAGMRQCRFTSDPPIAVGSTYEQIAAFMGRQIKSSFVVTVFDPGRSITIETVESTFPIKVTRTVEPLGDSRCGVTALIEGGPGGVLGLLAPLMKRMAQRSVRGDYRRLRNLLER